jgi:hypothetical protein
MRFFGVATLPPPTAPFSVRCDGTSGRSIILVTHDDGGVVARGFIWLVFETPLVELSPNSERPLRDLRELIKDTPDSIGISPYCRTVRMHLGVEMKIVQSVCAVVLSRGANAFVAPTIEPEVDDVIDLYLRGNPVLPTNLEFLNMFESEKSRLWAYDEAGYIVHPDVFLSRHAPLLLRDRDRCTLDRGKVVLVDGVGLPVEDLLRRHILDLCRAIEPTVQRISTYGPIGDTERQIAVALGGRKRKTTPIGGTLGGNVTLESAPPCIANLGQIDMRDMRRFHLAVIVAQVCRYKGLDPATLVVPLVDIFSRGINAHRSFEIKVRIDAALKARPKDDPINCWKRTLSSNRGIPCPYDDVRQCIAHRTKADLDPQSITIPEVWLKTNPLDDECNTFDDQAGSPRW